MRQRRSVQLLCIAIVTGLLASCANIDVRDVLAGPTPIPGAGVSSLPTAEVLFGLQVPSDTPADAAVVLEIIDVVTGISYNTERYPLDRTGDDSWQVRLTVPVGSLLRYRYVRTAPTSAVEATAAGVPVDYRVAQITGGMEFSDIVASWGEGRYSGPTGRLLGRVTEQGPDLPLSEMIVTAAGLSTFTDGDGRFRLEGLPPGLHNVVVYDPDGAHRTMQQGAVVAADATTPADFRLQPARPVTLTFELTVLPGAPAGSVRMAGDVRSLGAVFASLPGGIEVSANRMPTMVRVDDTHFLSIGRFYAGTDLRYKYTLGDGLWNAERDASSRFLTRQWIVPETDATASDVVASWSSDQEPLVIQMQPPEDTPDGDQVALQLNPFAWFEPLPMQSAADGGWQLTLQGPLDFGDELHYRYCRNSACGIADDIDTGGPNAAGRTATLSGPRLPIVDQVAGWAWWEPQAAQGTPQVAAIPARPDLAVGYELAPLYRPGWAGFGSRDLDRAQAAGANSIVLVPSWKVEGDGGRPQIEFDPTSARFRPDLIQQVATARERGLQVAIRPELAPALGTLDEWWHNASRSSDWWDLFFDELRSFLLTEATNAEASGADTLVLTGAQLAPALPAGSLADGSASGAPYDAEIRWRDLVSDLRASFHGRLAYEIELGEGLQAMPAFLGDFDEVHVYWHAPLSQDDGASFGDLRAEAARLLETEIIPVVPEGMPITISIEYLSLANAANACPANPDGSCRPASAFDGGAVVDADLPVDLAAQSEAIEAVMAEATLRTSVAGITIRRYFPMAALQDKSASVYGKPSGDVIRSWYEALRGEPASQ
jgi:hypothetical protein